MAGVFVRGPASVTRAAAPASSEQAADQRAHSKGDDGGVIRMLPHDLVGRPGFFRCLLASADIDFPAVLQGSSEPFSCFADFFSGHIGSGGHQGARVFGEGAQIVADCLCMFIHNYRFFSFPSQSQLRGKISLRAKREGESPAELTGSIWTG